MIGKEEIQAVSEALTKRHLTNAGLVQQFEEHFADFCGGGMAVAVSSCTAALHISAMIHFKPGDEVIVPALTHVSTAHAIKAVGAVPVFADCGPDGNVSRETIAPVITRKTRGVMVMHYLGKPCDMHDIKELCWQHDLVCIEDCALALGARIPNRYDLDSATPRTHVGLFGAAGCFSFYPAKHITTGEGGMILTRHPDVAEKARKIRAFGQVERHGDVTMMGLNYRMTEMQAAMGLIQLGRLPGFLRVREANYNALKSNLPVATVDSGGGAFYGLTVHVPEGITQQAMIHRAAVHRIEVSVYYPNPVPSLSLYQSESRFPNAERISCRTICLPVGPHLGKDHIQHMIRSLGEILSPSSAALAS